MERRSLLALAAPLIAAGLSNAAGAQTATDGGDVGLDRSGFRQFMELPGKKSYLVEVSPPFDLGGLTAFHGASILYEILCVVVAARAART